MMDRKSFSVRMLRAGGAVSVLLAGCGNLGGLEWSNDDTGDIGVPPPSLQPIDPAVVTLRLVNISEFALDVQFYLSTDLTVMTPDQLFVPEFAYTAGIGFLSRGVLDAGQATELAIECGQALFLGTRGGEFLDPASGDSIAAGLTVRFANLGPQFDCGDRVTFRFSPDVDGRPVATLGIE